jgi:hypothetical protein
MPRCGIPRFRCKLFREGAALAVTANCTDKAGEIFIRLFKNLPVEELHGLYVNY